jgi:hypothetical protein
MEIVRKYRERSTIEAFAEKHGLIMEICERDHGWRLAPLFGSFIRVEVKNGSILLGAYGNGFSEGEVIRDYAKLISGKLIVFDALGPNRKEIQCPIFVEKEEVG